MYGEIAMTFKIDKVGFYKMRNGEKCEVVHIIGNDKCCIVRHGDYITLSIDGFYWCESKTPNGYDIISKWVEPRKVLVPELVIGLHENASIIIYHGDNFIGGCKIIERIPAHEITITD